MSDSIGQAIADLNQAIRSTSAFTADQALAIAALIPDLHQFIAPSTGAGPENQPAYSQDPRFALALAQSTELAAHQALRTQVYAAHLLESTAAHTLTTDELEAVRAGSTDFTEPAQCTSQRPSFRNSTDLLASWLCLEHFEAQRRTDSAHHVFAQYDYQHHVYPAQFPLMAQRFHDGSLPPAEALSAARRLGSLEPKRTEFAPPTTSTVRDEQGQLVESVLNLEMDESEPATRHKAVTLVIKTAREHQSQEQPEAEEGIFRKGLRRGLIWYEMGLRPVRAELFESGLAQSDNPRSGAGQTAREAFVDKNAEAQESTGEHPDFVTDEEAATAESTDSAPISPATRRLNAVMNLLELNAKRLKRLQEAMGKRANSPDSSPPETEDPDLPVIKPQVVVMLTLAELEGRAETHGITGHGFKLSATDLRQTLAKAKIIPMVLGGKGELLDIGRSQRKHPGYMRLGISVRDRGCIVPGCTMDPERCNIHHIWSWSEGGVTSVYWSAMLCDTHHHDVHAGLIKVIPDGGVPKVILPNFVDPTQTPVRNRYNDVQAA
ncbi:HNH endonuclease signature motif containing protein [Arthrobacter sp. NIO-1057]|uniref:HNH endonuclease signature motif containing protein n=1 Tax=Arthrobacter sp. NIO-1057 TaxID=993071 RepID=UPI00071C3DA9|nr:HNH endonuclease signature motif containing protein [Arthrobacter sp. NIO-1057]KSU68167.1 hypothetical protein AS038_03525 [Arthrobacter sp. NIO-1057]SCB90548.1 protein of unknown function [Arthrobacter sp. NIO-1057]